MNGRIRETLLETSLKSNETQIKFQIEIMLVKQKDHKVQQRKLCSMLSS